MWGGRDPAPGQYPAGAQKGDAAAARTPPAGSTRTALRKDCTKARHPRPRAVGEVASHLPVGSGYLYARVHLRVSLTAGVLPRTTVNCVVGLVSLADPDARVRLWSGGTGGDGGREPRRAPVRLPETEPGDTHPGFPKPPTPSGLKGSVALAGQGTGKTAFPWTGFSPLKTERQRCEAELYFRIESRSCS